MTRIPDVDRDELTEPQQKAYDQMLASGATPQGPGAIAIHSPELAILRTAPSNYLRFGTSIPDRILELAILTTARCLDCPYVWNAHAAPARKAGASAGLVDALRDRQPLPAMEADESAVVRYGLELMQKHRVSNETFQTALEQFGTQHLVELTALMGQYAQNVFFLNAFAVDLLAESTETRLPV
jgi:4-carboxymuconolactone decarboxylase